MRFDPPGFTGPSFISYDRSNRSNRLCSCTFPRRSSRIYFFLRQPTTARIPRSRFRTPVPFVRRYETFERPREQLVAEGRGAFRSWPYYDRYATSVRVSANRTHRQFVSSSISRRSVEFDDRFKTRNATAFRFSYNLLHHRSNGVRPRIRTLANIFGKSGKLRRDAQQENVCRQLEVESEEEKEERDEDEDYNEDGSGSASDRESRSRCFRARSGNPTKSCRKKKDDDRDRSVYKESVSFFRISTTNATNVPPVDAFLYTAYNDENEREKSCRYIGSNSRVVTSFHGIGNVCDGQRKYRGEEETKFRRGVRGRKDESESNERDDICGNGGERFRQFRSRGKTDRSSEKKCTRGKLRVDSGSSGKCGSQYYTARFQEPITNDSCENETDLSTNRPTKVSNSYGRKYGLLFILYLLAWPLVCSTNPSGQFVSGFTHNPSFGLADNLSQHNATQISSLLSSSSSLSFSSSSSSSLVHQRQQHQQQQKQRYRQLEEEHEAREQFVRDTEYSRDVNGHHRRRHEDQQQQQQQPQQQQQQQQQQQKRKEQNREQREAEEFSYRDREHVLEFEAIHPYNEYSWEVNQINPWLSACDLAGPAPADLQGSCGPPEVPKNCPVPCATSSNGNENDAEFLEVIEKVEVTKRYCYWSTGGGEENPESERFGSSSIKSSGAGGNGEASSKKGRRTTDRGKAEDGVQMAPEQCLFYLEESHKRDICRDDFGRSSTRSFLTPRENRYWFMSGLRLRHCCEHAVVNALAPGKGGPLENVLNGGQKCADALDKLLLVDALAARLHCEFEEVLARYDCAQPYSVIFNCTHCKEAYRKWVCSSLVPYFAHGGPQDLDNSNSWAGSRLKPCRSFCQSVEQRCPYLLPGDRAPAYPTQYAGEPTFLCKDPNILETGEQAARALHSSEDDCCFHACSEELPGSGICANCTNREPRRRGRGRDPPTAPRCEINPIQSASSGGEYQRSRSTDNSLGEGEERYGSSTDSEAPLMMNTAVQQGTLLCGTEGGVDSIASVSSSDRSTASIIPQLVWLCSLLISILSNVRTFPVLWISKIFLWSVVQIGGGNGDGERGSMFEETSQLTDLIVWLRRCFGRASYVTVRYGAKWLVEKWVVVERRCRNWWCCCWYWWWWRWRRISPDCGRVRWEFRPRRSREKNRSCRFALTSTTIAIIAALIENESFYHSQNTSADLFAEHSSKHARVQRRRRQQRQRRWTQNYLVYSFTVNCPWRRWSWWWWWLYRWWRLRKMHYSGSIEDRASFEERDRYFALRRDLGKTAGQGKRRSTRKTRRKERRKRVRKVFEEDVRSSPTRRRGFKLSSRKDPP